MTKLSKHEFTVVAFQYEWLTEQIKILRESRVKLLKDLWITRQAIEQRIKRL